MRTKRLISLACLVVAVLPSDGARAATRNVTVSSNLYTPNPVEASPGDEVVWTFAGGTHTVTAWEGASFSSGTKSSGTFSATFEGTPVKYRCTLHSSVYMGSCNGMCGVIASTDKTPPPAPTILKPLMFERLSSQLVYLEGTASSDSVKVRLHEGTERIAELPVTAGRWSVSVGFWNGSHTVSATAFDIAGNESSAATVTFGVFAGPGAPPPTIVTPAGGSVGANRSVLVDTVARTGTSRVAIRENGELLGTLTAAPNNHFTGTINLPDGDHTIVAHGVDSQGVEGEPSLSVTFGVDGVRPVARISQPQSFSVVTRPFTITGTATDNRKVVSVRLAWGVNLRQPSQSAGTTCTGCGTPTATWSTFIGTSAAAGIYEIVPVAEDEAGSTSTGNSITVVVI